MASLGDAREPMDAPSVNAQLSFFLQQHASFSSFATSELSCEGLRRYPLPVLTGATATDAAGFAGMRAQPVAAFDLSASSTNPYGRLHSVASAVHQFWQTSDASSSTDSSHATGGEATSSSSHAVHHPTGRGEEGVGNGAAWLAQSPFRGCARASFHARLRQLATPPSSKCFDSHNTNSSIEAPCQGPLSWMDALCHGFSTAAAAVDDDGPSRRKRLRTASAVAVTQPPPPPQKCQTTACNQNADVCTENVATAAIARDVRRMTTVEAHEVATRETRAPSPALRSRVTENDDLLGMLLGVPTVVPAAIAEDRPMKGGDGEANGSAARSHADLHQRRTSAPETTQQEAAAAPQVTANAKDRRPVDANALSSDDEACLMRCSVKELKDTCARLGLLSTGSKHVLLQRIQLYQSSRKPTKDTTNTSMPASQLPSATPFPPLSGRRDVSLAAPAATPPVLLSSRSASGLPPRTVFRYRSPSAPPGASTVTVATADNMEGKTRVSTPHSASPLTVTLRGSAATSTALGEDVLRFAPTMAPPAPPSRRVVPSPTAFLQQLVATHHHQQQQIIATSLPTAHNACEGTEANLCVSDKRTTPPLLSPAASRAQEDALKSEMSAVRWQWLVDFRERAGGQRGSRSKHEGMIDAFRRQQVPCTSVMLPCGDFMLAVDLSPQEADELQQAHQRGSSSAASVLSQAEESTNEVRGATGNAPAEPSPIFGHVCSLVVERKTAADLDASVKGSRYSEQRRLLAASPYALVVWLIEGTDVGGGGAGRSAKGGFFSRPHTCPQQGGSRSPSPAPNDSDVASATDVASVASPTSPSSPVESAQQRVDSACASLGMQQQQQHGSWLVVRTRNTAESVQFLKQLALQVARQLAARRLTHRETSSASRSALPIVTTDMDLARVEVGAHLSSSFCSLPLARMTAPSRGESAAHVCRALSHAFLQFGPTQDCLQSVGALQRRLRAQTAFPRMLLCVRGCSPSLAALLTSKYGSLMGFWRALRRHGREACDADRDIRRLSTAQKKVFILLTEFLLAKDYY